MENTELKPMIRGAFYFDRRHVSLIIPMILAIAAAAVAIVNNFVAIPYAWMISGGLAILAALIMLFVMMFAAKIACRRLELYQDHIEFWHGKKCLWKLSITDVAIMDHRGDVLFLNNRYLIDRLFNAEEIADKINELLHPEVVRATLGTDVTYVNLGIEELRKANELLSLGMISQEDYDVIKNRYMESEPDQYLIHANGMVTQIER